ncbi:MAG TPA: exonuclease SbcCD subunit D [Dehalococcoidia bacterium]|nr:exonuclease SbcCD subunit D [Dehalococcoidia bacterium]
MKILHFADLHLGVETYGNVDPATGLSTRLLDVLRALDVVVEYATGNKVDLVLFCGDTYKSRDPSQTHQREFAKRLRRLSQEGIPVFLLVGNHDLPSAIGRATAVEIFDTLAVSNIYVGSRPDIYRIPTKQGYVQVVALPWLRRSALLSREEAKNLSIDQINDKLQEIMTRRLWDIISGLDPALPALLAAHVSVSTARPGSERSMVVGRDPVLLLGNIAQSVFDYVALGHIHKSQVLSQNPPVVYAGSLERLDFSDEDEDKGFYVVDVEPGGGKKHVTYEFHKVDARRFVTVKVDIDAGDPDPTATILATIAKHRTKIKEAIVRIQLSLPRTLETLLRDAEIYKALKGAHDVTVAKEIRQESRLRLGDWASEELMPIEALKVYLATKKVPEERQRLLLEYGESLIRESVSNDGGNYGG